MSHQGRSPINDVVRSVVMSAAMISPALLAACREANPPPPNPEPLPTTTTDPIATSTGTVPTATPTTTATTTTVVVVVDPVPTAPPSATVRPRTNPTAVQMPTRGFAGAVRARS